MRSKSDTKPYVKEVDVFTDDRGTFVPFMSFEDLPGKKASAIKRVYYVYNYSAGVVRGYHFHKHEWKYFIAVAGAAKVVALDVKRPDNKYVFITSARKPNLVVIPPGYANGWVSLEENTVLVCGSTSSFAESIQDDIRFDPYKWGDVWSVAGR